MEPIQKKQKTTHPSSPSHDSSAQHENPNECRLLDLPPELFRMVGQALYSPLDYSIYLDGVSPRPDYSKNKDGSRYALEHDDRMKTPSPADIDTLCSFASTSSMAEHLCLNLIGPQCIRYRRKPKIVKGPRQKEFVLVPGDAQGDEERLLRMVSSRLYRHASFLDVHLQHGDLNGLKRAISSMPQLKGFRYVGWAHPLDVLVQLPPKLQYLELGYWYRLHPVADVRDAIWQVDTLVLADVSRQRGILGETRRSKSMKSEFRWSDIEVSNLERLLKACRGVTKLVLRMDRDGEHHLSRRGETDNNGAAFLRSLGKCIDEGGMAELETLVLDIDMQDDYFPDVELTYLATPPAREKDFLYVLTLRKWLEGGRAKKMPKLRSIQLLFHTKEAYMHPGMADDLYGYGGQGEAGFSHGIAARMEQGPTEPIMKQMQAEMLPTMEDLKEQVRTWRSLWGDSIRELDIQVRLPLSAGSSRRAEDNPPFFGLHAELGSSGNIEFSREVDTDAWRRSRWDDVAVLIAEARESALLYLLGEPGNFGEDDDGEITTDDGLAEDDADDEAM